MSGQKLGKICRKTLFNCFQIWRKGVSSQCPQNVSTKFETKSDITPETSNNSYTRKSPINICMEQTSRKKDSKCERLFENDLAAKMQIRSSGILRDYYLNHRFKQSAEEEYPKKISNMVEKLNDIMSLNVATTEPKLNQEKRFDDKYYSKCISQCMDYKPQANSNVNRWFKKMPQYLEICENKESLTPMNVQGRPEKLRKLVELPRISANRSICLIPNEEKEVIQKCKPQEYWQFGSLTFPRLEL